MKEAAHHGSLRDFKSLRNFLVAHPLDLAEQDDGAVVGREGREGAVDLTPELLVASVSERALTRCSGRRRGDGGGGVVAQGPLTEVVDLDGASTCLGALLVDAEVHADPVDPRREGGVPLEVCELLVGLDERVLDDVHGVVAVFEHADGDRVEATLVALDELLEGRGFAALCPRDELRVLGAVALARLPLPAALVAQALGERSSAPDGGGFGGLVGRVGLLLRRGAAHGAHDATTRAQGGAHSACSARQDAMVPGRP